MRGRRSLTLSTLIMSVPGLGPAVVTSNGIFLREGEHMVGIRILSTGERLTVPVSRVSLQLASELGEK